MTPHSITIQRSFKAPRDRVFAAFTEHDGIAAWFGPEGCTTPNVTVDARPGGKYRVEMHCGQSGVHVVVGEYREVSPPERLVFTWRWLEGERMGPETLVTVTLAARGSETELTLVHSAFPTREMGDMHQQGWTSSFECLVRSLAGEPQKNVALPTVLGDPRSTYVRSARMALVEKGIAYTLEPHAPQSEAMRAAHPWGKVPALRYNEIRLFETSAILRYIDESYPGPALMPVTPAERAHVEQWISAINCYMYDAMITRYVLQYVIPRGPGGKPDRAVIDAALLDVNKQLGILENAYSGRSHLVGERMSLADLLLAPIVFYLTRTPEGNDLLARHSNVRRAHEAIAARDSFKTTPPPMG